MGLFGSSRPLPHSEVRSKSYRVFRPRQWASLERGAGCPRWVKSAVLVVRHHFRFSPINRHSQSSAACLKGANRRHRACTPLANFLSEDLAFTRKGQSEHNFSCWRALRPPLDAVLAYVTDELRTIMHQILCSPKLPPR